MGNQIQPLKRYMPGLDGLRAISVIAVIAYHFNWSLAKGGLLGVEIFFVISGYLITDQLLWEWRTQVKLSLLQFWMRRIRRLLPAMVCMLLLVACWLVVIDSSRMQALRGDFLSSLLYVNNWYLILHKVSYFESFGPASPIGHLWSLSIEEQFYMIWPLLLWAVIKLWRRRGKLILFILLAATASAITMAALYVPGTDPSRVYYGTDTRAFAILIGAALAVIWPSWKLTAQVSSPARTLLDLSGALGLVSLIILIHHSNEYDASLYPVGFLLVSVVTAVVIAVLAHPASRLGLIMSVQPLSWIGKRSYSLYIWHYPVIILTSPPANAGEPGLADILLQLILTILLSALSYKYIEEPIRKRGFWAQFHLRKPIYFKLLSGFSLGLLVLLIIAVWRTNPTKIKQDAVPVIAEQVTPSDEISPDHHDQQKQNIPSGEGREITAIGDSLLLNIAPYLEQMLPGIVIDGKVGRQMSHVQDVVGKLRSEGKLKKKIIIELGTNGSFNKGKLRSLLNSLQESEQVYLITTRVPKNWQDSVNDAIREISGEYPNVKIIDWYSASEDKANLFYKDGVHLKPEGAKYYASMVAEAIRQDTN